MTKYSNDQLRNLLGITSAISDETRIRILMMLNIAELCVCQITAALNLAPSTTSRHLSILEAADLIRRRKVGRWVHYKLNDPSESKPVKDALKLVSISVSKSQHVTEDRRRIKALLKEDISIICKRLYHGQIPSEHLKGKTNGARIKA
jgi:DNA-binding transcriptional ArsR family regulator